MIKVRQHFACLLMVLCFLSHVPVALAQEASSESAYRPIQWDELVSNAPVRDRMLNDINLQPHSEDAQTFQNAVDAYTSAWANAPINPALNNVHVQISGFVVPLERDENTALVSFLLVPYFGACIHVPPPPVNQIIYVELDTPQAGIASMDQITVSGLLQLAQTADQPEGAAYTLSHVKKMSNLMQPSDSTWFAACITLFSGLSICLGLALAGWFKKINARLFCISISFAAGVMTVLGLSIVVIQFSWESVTGFIVSIILMLMVHRFLHASKETKKNATGQGRSFLSGKLAIALHNLPECFAIYSTTLFDYRLGLMIACMTILHNIPLGFSFSLPHVTHRWLSAGLVAVIPTLLGILIYTFLKPLFSPVYTTFLFSAVGGMMVVTALKELIPSAALFGSARVMVVGYLLGIVFVFVAILLSLYAITIV